jgi:hypothetical protein
MPVKWVTPEVVSYREAELMAEFAATATVTPVHEDIPHSDAPGTDDDDDDD